MPNPVFSDLCAKTKVWPVIYTLTVSLLIKSVHFKKIKKKREREKSKKQLCSKPCSVRNSIFCLFWIMSLQLDEALVPN